MIKKYFNNDNFYKTIIKKKKDPRIIKEYKKILFFRKKIKFVYQNKPMGTGDDVSALVLFLVTNEAGYITGQNIHVNGGLFLA